MYSKILLVFIFFIQITFAKTVVTTLPEFSWVVTKLYPESSVKSLLSGLEDAHFVDATPSFIFKAAKADILIINGLGLEVGWIPKVITQSGNARIQVGEQGYCDVGASINALGQLKNFDRSMGDVHPEGNPHYSISIKRMISAVKGIENCLYENFKDEEIKKNAQNLIKLLEKESTQFKNKLSKKSYYSYHKEFDYLVKDYGLSIKGTLEKVPGVLPSASYLTKIAKKSKKDSPKLVLAGKQAPTKILMKFEELSGIPYKKVDLHPRRGQDYIEFIRSFSNSL